MFCNFQLKSLTIDIITQKVPPEEDEQKIAMGCLTEKASSRACASKCGDLYCVAKQKTLEHGLQFHPEWEGL
ncbi:MAG: hypothetical protein GYA55_10890 [SAR324 cluster bacterium]|uniref:Uncharacterized protein n=1 Tax=SAR324 cluster bacterium TaxID=2024889 RepID=A0A7X9FTJ6_9DELT|nr:hypothetical protein [SAR324 cluster bacterium]